MELEVEDNRLIISHAVWPRAGWVEAFQLMAERGDDSLLDADVVSGSRWDEEAWEWK